MGDAVSGLFKMMVGVIAVLFLLSVLGWCVPRTSAACKVHAEYATTDSLRSVIATKHPECATVLFTTHAEASK